MFEGILIFAFYIGSNGGVITTIRYDSIEQCQLAKQAVINDPALNAGLPYKLSLKDNVWCIPVPKEVK